METLKNFLHPKRKENIQFVLSDSFGELAKLVRIYNQHNRATLDFQTLKEEAKN